MGNRILLINGNPNPQSFCSALSDAYVQGATGAGHEVRRLNLVDLAFDPVLRGGFKGEQPLEAGLQKAQQDILWAQHLVVVHPVWWGAVPALLKGFIDRTFLPGFAFKYRQGSALWDKLLTGRSARIISTSDTPGWWMTLFNHNPPLNMLKTTVLEFCGVSPVRATQLRPIRGSSTSQREQWLRQVTDLGAKGN
jgi:putative NADPH-quinone reductase